MQHFKFVNWRIEEFVFWSHEQVMNYLILQERAEWINSIIQQLWPNIGHYTRKIINDTVEPEVKKALNIYNLTGFKFEKVVLGKKKNFKNFVKS